MTSRSLAGIAVITIAALTACGEDGVPQSSPTTTAEGSYTWTYDESFEWAECVASRLEAFRTEHEVRAAGSFCVALMRPDLAYDSDFYAECAAVTHGWNDNADALTFGSGLEECMGR